MKRGEVIYILHYSGEGYWTVWHNGKLVEIENFSDEGLYSKPTCWVKVKTTSGVVEGWAPAMAPGYSTTDLVPKRWRGGN